MTGDISKAARWLGLSLIASSLIVVIGLRWPSAEPTTTKAYPVEKEEPHHLTPERIHGGIM